MLPKKCSIMIARGFHYSASGFLISVGGFTAILSLYLLSQSIGHPLGSSMGLCFGLLFCAVAIAGLFVTIKRNTWYLSLLLLLQAIGYVCFFAAAVTMSVFMPTLTGMDDYSMPELNGLSGQDGSFYRGTRTIFQYIYKHAQCIGGVCSSRDNVSSCTTVKCSSSKDLTKTVNDLLNRRWIGPGSGSSMSYCAGSALDDQAVDNVIASSATTWCGCSMEVFRYMKLWSPWILAVLWVTVFFISIVAATTLKALFLKKFHSWRSAIRSVGRSVGRSVARSSDSASVSPPPADVEFVRL
ncbi:hypothetical protein FOL47_006956 [Perkinsus chesapeaki]|uniref:Uncharacterized protein n=1 Tax=Perkinsus chesapeaki TaxID=330153 RepID=A0A7J6N354_PERCH|nr:hypothetical protein FOL47_006956 [Perkinsus chesapeaki]